MTEVYEQIDAAVASGGGLQSMAGVSEESKALYSRLEEAISSCQSGLIERDIEVAFLSDTANLGACYASAFLRTDSCCHVNTACWLHQQICSSFVCVDLRCG